MDLFDLAAKISLDDSSFNQGIANAEKAGKGLGSSLQNTFDKIKSAAKLLISGAAIKKGIDLMMGLANATSQAGDRIDKQSQVLGMSRKSYQEWDYILSQNGASIDSMNIGMKTLNSTILSASEGSEEAKNAFAKLGVGIHELEGMSMEDQFEAVVRAFQALPAGAQKSALAVKMFGRNGMELLPLLNQSTTSIDELRKRAQELGIIMGDDAVDAAVVYGDTLDDLQRMFDGIKYSIGAKVLPTLTNGMEKLIQYSSKLRTAYEERGFAGVWDTLVADFKAIKWPTWDDVASAIKSGWDSIVQGVKGLAKLVFGENVDGSIKWPTWTDVKNAVENGWNTIVEGVSSLSKIIFGDQFDITKITSLEDLLGKIQEGWKNLKDTVTQGAINIATYFFGDADPTTVADTIKTIGTVLESVGAAIVTYFTVQKVKGIIDFFKNFKSIFTTAVGNNKLGLILSGIAAAITLLIENWDKIEPIIAEVGTWLNDNLIGPIMDFVDAIKTAIKAIGSFFGIDTSGWFGGDNGFVPPQDEWGRNPAGYSTAHLDDAQVQSLYATRNLIKQNPNATFIGSDNQTRSGADALKHVFEETMKAAGFDDSIVKNFSSKLDDISDSGFTDLMNTLRNAEGFYDENGQKIGGLSEGAQVAAGSIGELGSAAGNAAGVLNSIHAPDWGSIPGHAKGLWSVPYDGYVAKLHRSERVLTASQARRYSEGEGGSMDMAALVGAIQQAVVSGMSEATVKSYISGRDVTDDVNRNTVRQLKARRFAT